MHGTALSRTKRRPRSHWRATRTGTLKNRLAGDRTPGRRTDRRSRCSLRRNRRLVNRTRPSLRHDHARRRAAGDRHSRTNSRNSRLARNGRRRRTRRYGRNRGGRRGHDWGRLHRNWRRSLWLRRRRWRRYYVHGTRTGVRQNHARRGRWWRSRRLRNSGRDRRGGRGCGSPNFDSDRWKCRTRRGWRSYRRRRLLLTDDGLQDISGLRYLRKIDLGFDFVWLDAAAAGALV
jgi:hypothetical protein